MMIGEKSLLHSWWERQPCPEINVWKNPVDIERKMHSIVRPESLLVMKNIACQLEHSVDAEVSPSFAWSWRTDIVPAGSLRRLCWQRVVFSNQRRTAKMGATTNKMVARQSTSQ